MMVSSRIVDCHEEMEEHERRPIPEMMFAEGEEPVGVRVLTYMSSRAIKRIVAALDEEEVGIIRKSSFGKLVEIGDQPAFSGRFARYILSRQLKTKKKHELWFRFAGKPIRFSLREFAIVTGLPCGNYPTKSKMKLKETISVKPYWPSLFGKVEVVTVSSVIKMLTKRTVKERLVRVKYACLAIISSVLLPTNIKMKISREYVEAIEDLEEFFLFPWGRLAFDMLMSSIKEKDEVALSQNNFAIKGFVLALQLVLVEAVPSLREGVHETCSSSEGDSDEECDEVLARHRKQTLSPGHARNIDKKSNVLVRSIIDPDPDRLLDETIFEYIDEVVDERVENIVYLIKQNYQFCKSMFVGGLSKVDVQRLRESAVGSHHQKKIKKPAAISYSNDPCEVVSLFAEKMKPDFQMLELKVTEACEKVALLEGSYVNALETMFIKFKEDILNSVRCLFAEFCKDKAPPEVGDAAMPMVQENGEFENATSASQRRVIENENEIRIILSTLNDFSSPPPSLRPSKGNYVSRINDDGAMFGYGQPDPCDHSGAVYAQSQNQTRPFDLNKELYVGGMGNHEMPSFSLGLTQEERMESLPDVILGKDAIISEEDRVNEDEGVDEQKLARRSKRQKCFPQGLVTDYQCDGHMLSHLRHAEKHIFVLLKKQEIDRIYGRMLQKLSVDRCVHVDGIAVSVRDIKLIAERSQFLTAKVVDILVHLLRSAVKGHLSRLSKGTDFFLDARFAASMATTYQKFSKCKKKSAFVFPKGLVDYCKQGDVSNLGSRRYYFPLKVGKKLWVAICVEVGSSKLVVLDCNSSLLSDGEIDKYVNPLCQMFPLLLSSLVEGSGVHLERLFIYERSKYISTCPNHCDSGLVVVLSMGTHAIYGNEECKDYTEDLLWLEGKSAAILAYQLGNSG